MKLLITLAVLILLACMLIGLGHHHPFTKKVQTAHSETWKSDQANSRG